jgi:hypothetical protein
METVAGVMVTDGSELTKETTLPAGAAPAV